jgi:flagellar M-ring protein FliF
VGVLGVFAERLGAWWKSANATQRLLLVGGVVAAVLSTAFVVSWSSRPDYEVLFSGLSAEDAGPIVEELAEAGVRYEVAKSGSTILVESSRVGEMRLRVAGKGLTGKGTVGYEIFDKTNLGMTEFLQQVNYRRALEGELTRTIMSLEEVEKARVHLAMPEKSVFRREEKKPTASVIVDLRPGARLANEQVRGIYALVSASVEGLDPDGVTVIDTTGRVLGDRAPSGELALTSEQLRIQQEVETTLRDKATSMLEQVVGAGDAIVQISATLDFDRVERSIEMYNPATTSIRSEQRITGTGVSGDSEETILTNYEIDKTVERILGEVGTIDRLSVAVLVNGVESTNQAGETLWAERSPEELEKLASMVRSAVGISEERGDVLEIANLRFAPTAAEEVAASPMPWWLFFPSMGSLLKNFVILLAIGLVAWGLRQSSSILVKAVEDDRRRRERVLALETKSSSEADIRKEVIREQMNELARERPSEVASVLRNWLVEERTP